ncbi:ENV1 protein, partial [Climacteris rufus]|nr:ENV1 protein [Climacteris rufus]
TISPGNNSPAHLWEIIQASYQALNESHPNITNSCWLCYDVKPPYYEAIGFNSSYNLDNTQNPPQCKWGRKKKGLTMQQVQGKGFCVG